MTKLSYIGAAALVVVGCGAALAMPGAAPTRTRAPIVLVRDGCGPGFHLGARDGCVPNGGREYVEPRVVGPRGGPREVAPIRLPPPCPRGWVRDPDPARPICYPRF